MPSRASTQLGRGDVAQRQPVNDPKPRRVAERRVHGGPPIQLVHSRNIH